MGNVVINVIYQYNMVSLIYELIFDVTKILFFRQQPIYIYDEHDQGLCSYS